MNFFLVDSIFSSVSQTGIVVKLNSSFGTFGDSIYDYGGAFMLSISHHLKSSSEFNSNNYLFYS